MTPLTIIRAWKDEEYRATLTDTERAQLPAHPAGFIELTNTELDRVAGGVNSTLASTTCDTNYRWCSLFPGCGTAGC